MNLAEEIWAAAQAKEEAYQYGYWDALTDIQRLLTQLEAHKEKG